MRNGLSPFLFDLPKLGDTAGGYPGLRGWGPKSAGAVLTRYGYLEQIPTNWGEWGLNLASPKSLPETLLQNRKLVFLFRDLATLRTDILLFGSGSAIEMERSHNGLSSIGCTPRCSPEIEMIDVRHSQLSARLLMTALQKKAHAEIKKVVPGSPTLFARGHPDAAPAIAEARVEASAKGQLLFVLECPIFCTGWIVSVAH